MKPAVLLLDAGDDGVHGGDVGGFEAAADRVGEHFFRQAAVEILAALDGEHALQLAHIGELFAGDELAGGVDLLAVLLLAKQPEGVEIFQRQPERIHAVVAGGAGGFFAMDGERFAEGRLAVGGGGFGGYVEVGNVGRRRRHGCAEDVVEDKQAAFHGRGARGVRGHGQHRAVGEDAAARVVRRELHKPQFVASDVGDAVVRGEAGVEKGVVAVDELGERAILPHDVGEVGLGLLPHRQPQLRRERARRAATTALHGHTGHGLARENRLCIDGHGGDVADPQPLTGEVCHQRGGARIGQHPPHLRVQPGAQLARGRESEQLLVRHRGPEEIGEPRSQRKLVHQRVGVAGLERLDTLVAKKKTR